MSKINKISVLIPCYNEENTISQVIIKVEKSLLNLNIDYEIVVVDDYSSDNSSKKLLELKNEKKIKLYTHNENLGKGAAIATGLKHITGEIILIQDADLEYDPEDYKKLLLPFDEANADVGYGPRFWEANMQNSFFCTLANKPNTLCIWLPINPTDISGYKLFRYEKIKIL